MKYKYSTLDYSAERQRSCYIVGKVYIFTNDRGERRGILEGDTLLCIRKSGDCHYDFIRIKKESETSYNELHGKPPFQLFSYFKLFNKVSCYGGMMEAFPKMEALSELDLVHVLYSKLVLIPLLETLTKSQLKQLEKKWELQDEILKTL